MMCLKPFFQIKRNSIFKLIYLFSFLTMNLFFLNGQDLDKKPFFLAPSGFSIISTDLHIHTVFSDGSVWPNIRVKEALKEGLDLIAITDHIEYLPHRDDIPYPDRNRPFNIAKEFNKSSKKLRIINGSEITRDISPSGHFNAVFLKDANKLVQKDSLTGIIEANKQNAFVFWNHPNWDSTGIARLKEFQTYLVNKKLLHGIEVVNETTYSEEAFQIAIDNNLTILGNSDIHELTEWTHDISSGGHRPITFVLTKGFSDSDLKKALFKGETLVWFKDLLIGKKTVLNKVLKSNLIFSKPFYPKGKTILHATLQNKSATKMQLKYIGRYSFHDDSDIITIEPYSELKLRIKTRRIIDKVNLPFIVLNALEGPKNHTKIDYNFIIN